MIRFQTFPIAYENIDTYSIVEHYVVKALNVKGKDILLSFPNIYLFKETADSLNTSKRYANVITMFYTFLSTTDKFRDINVGEYHVIADNNDIRRWQIERQTKRVAHQSESPTSKTIFEDARVVLSFFMWIEKVGQITNVNVETKTWVARFKSRRMLHHIQKEAKIAIDAKNIQALDKASRQKKSKSLITDREIEALLKSYVDPVYPALFLLGLGTGMRPVELVKFPYIGTGKNKDILPFPEMDNVKATVAFEVTGKGNKTRDVIVNLKDLCDLYELYTKPYYQERRKLYSLIHEKDCSPSILFLNKNGYPVTPKMISRITNNAKKKAKKIYPDFREKITFYEARHWWPTMFAIEFFKEKLLTGSAEALYTAFAQALTEQLGHNDIETTYKYYIDMARLVYQAQSGSVHELLTNPVKSVRERLIEMQS
ncbi:MAG: site-specific integrase [Gammaproteobacteria bacterium]|nr:site-specific integrase [Gammaproteobacteria bacterium]